MTDAISLFDPNRDIELINIATLAVAWLHYGIFTYEPAIHYAEVGYDLSLKTGNTYSTIEALDVLANSYGRLDESTFSIKSDSFFQEYLKLAKSIDNPTLNYWVACSEGNSFEFKGMHDRAKVHFEKALEMAIILQDSALHSEALLNLGENAQRQNDPMSAIIYLNQILHFPDKY